jgi:cysteine synthase
MPDKVAPEKVALLRAYGAQVVTTPTAVERDSPESYYSVADRLTRELPNAFQPNQYFNPMNPRTHYESTGPEIWQGTDGRITHFVAGVGTGGTITGVGRRLKEHDPDVRVWSVRPEIFPGIEGLKPLGHPGDIVPKILDASVVDAWTDVSSEEARAHARALAKRGLFVGQSSGGYLEGVRRAGREAGEGVIVTILSDFGERYLSTPLWEMG